MGNSRFRAFTLLELMISLSILSVIAALSYTSFVSVRKVVEVNRRNEDILRSIRWFQEKLDVEISGAIYVRRAEQTLFVSERKDYLGKKVNNLTFTTLSPQSYLEIGTRGEILKVVYEVEQNKDNNELLVVTKKVFYNLLSPEFRQEPVEYVIRPDFGSFTLRFYKGGKWYDSWDTEEMDLLPEGIELLFSIDGKQYREFFNVYISET